MGTKLAWLPPSDMVKIFSQFKVLSRASVAALAFVLAGCASPITAKVTRFHQWPADTGSATFSMIRAADKVGDLEQTTYENYVALQLEKLGLQRAPAGQVGRIQIDLVTGNGTRDRKYLEAIYQDNLVYLPPFRDAAGNVYPGFWAPDRFGSRYVGDREVTRTVQVSTLRLRLLDSLGQAAGKPLAVFESRAVYEGDNEDLAALVPYLVRAVFVDFPGQSGKVRTLKFDASSGALQTK
jgi:Domain of unknown function (DUF4136)